jgi:hypothetical protein
MSFNVSSHKISGIAFTGFDKRDELFYGDGLLDAFVAVSSPQGNADHFECNA